MQGLVLIFQHGCEKSIQAFQTQQGRMMKAGHGTTAGRSRLRSKVGGEDFGGEALAEGDQAVLGARRQVLRRGRQACTIAIAVDGTTLKLQTTAIQSVGLPTGGLQVMGPIQRNCMHEHGDKDLMRKCKHCAGRS